MDFLSNLYAIETTSDLFFIKFGLLISLVLFLPFLSVLIGSLLFSLSHVLKAKITKNTLYLDYAKYQIELITNRVIVRLLFGVLPFFGFVFFYTQLYSSSIPNSSENLFFAFLLFVAGLCLSVAYKNSFSLKPIKDSLDKSEFQTEEVNSSKFSFLNKGGYIGLVLLLFSSLISIGYLVGAGKPNNIMPSGLMGIIFNTSSILYILLFFTISFSITSAILLARMNRAGTDYSFKSYAREYSTKTGILFTFVQPIIFVLIIFSVNAEVLSFPFFTTSMLVMLFMLLASIQFYLNFKGNNLKSTSIVFIFLLLFTFLIYNGQIVSETAHKKEAIKSGKVLELFS